VFSRIGNFDRVMLEYDDERSGTFEALRDLPDDKIAVLGLVSTKLETVEAPDVLDARVRDAARFFPLEQIAVSTQCGFASIAVGNDISETAQERKLRAVADLSARVWS
jgi:5-methyltetrahydropteroyltriglutamate--homocysteine methyltransferase